MGVTKTRLIAIGKRIDHALTLTRLSACFEGRIPTELEELTALTLLDLRRTQLAGECPKQLA